MDELALLSADTDKIKQYVFESDKLPEIRGASAILRTLNEGDVNTPSIRRLFSARGLPLNSIIYAGGGSLLAIVPAALAEELRGAIEELYPSETGAATITAVCAPMPEAEGKFEDWLRQMQYRLQRAKESRTISPLFEAVLPARRCAACGIRPTAEQASRIQLPNGEWLLRPFDDRWLCKPCHHKLERGLRDEKADYVRRFEAFLQKHQPQEYWKFNDQTLSPDEVKWANDMREIAQAERKQRYIGFIYADGNGIGKSLFRVDKPEAFRQKSEMLREAVAEAVFRALAEHARVCRVEREDGAKPIIHPWEIIALGGDDALLIVPGDVALQVAEAMCRHFSDFFAEEARGAVWPERPTMSAGVAIAHESNPVRFVRELAEQLLKRAKRRAHELKKEGAEKADGTMDFVVLKSQSMLAADLETLREKAYTRTIAREKLYLIGRPFSLAELRVLLTHARLLRNADFPRSQIQAIRAELWEVERKGRPWSALFYHRQNARMPLEQQALLNVIAAYWRGAYADSPLDFYPWLALKPKRDHIQSVTLWEDLHEIHELLPHEAQESPTTRAETQEAEAQVKQELERLRKARAKDDAETRD